MCIQFGRHDHTLPTDAVIFIADGYGSDSVVETWCSTVDLFELADAANAWAQAHDITGKPIAVEQPATDAAATWAALVPV